MKAYYGFAPGKPNNRWRLDGTPIRPGSGPEVMPGPADTFAAYGRAWATLSNTPFRDAKLTAWEGGIRTPLIVRWPAVIQRGDRLTSQPGHVIDLMATCLDVAGADYPATLDGRKLLPLEGKSLVPILRGEQREPHEAICWSVPRNQAILMGKWKLVNSRRNTPWQLYDLDADATETCDLAAQHPERVREMAARFAQWKIRVSDK
jgi:arylsulfatase